MLVQLELYVTHFILITSSSILCQYTYRIRRDLGAQLNQWRCVRVVMELRLGHLSRIRSGFASWVRIRKHSSRTGTILCHSLT